MVKLTQSTSEQRYAKPSSKDQVVFRLTRSDYIPYMFNIYIKSKKMSVKKGLPRKQRKVVRGTYGRVSGRESLS